MADVTTKTTTAWSLWRVKRHLEIDVQEKSKDQLIATIADSVSERFEQRTGRLWVTRAGLVDVWNGDGRTARFLRYAPVVAVASLAVSGATLIESSDFVIDRDLGKVQLLTGGFGTGIGNCSVTYSAGYDVQDGPALPSDIVEAGLEQIDAIYKEKTAGAAGATSVSLGGMTFMVRPGMSYNVKDVLDARRDLRA